MHPRFSPTFPSLSIPCVAARRVDSNSLSSSSLPLNMKRRTTKMLLHLTPPDERFKRPSIPVHLGPPRPAERPVMSRQPGLRAGLEPGLQPGRDTWLYSIARRRSLCSADSIQDKKLLLLKRPQAEPLRLVNKRNITLAIMKVACNDAGKMKRYLLK